MASYRYDGSFEGFLCAVAHCLDAGERHPELIASRSEVDDSLFGGDVLEIPASRDAAMAFRERFVRVVSQQAFASARYAFHSGNAGIERLVWEYLRLGLAVGGRLTGMLAHEPVYSVSRVARQVAHEAHKFKGFVRFSEVEAGFLYAAIEPQADIVALIAPHFAGRIGDRPWMIHDLLRRRAAVFDLRSWRLVEDVELAETPELTEGENRYAALWRRYFQHHAISERHNPRLQQKHVPQRVRNHLTEFLPENRLTDP